MKYLPNPNSECQWYARGCAALGILGGALFASYMPDFSLSALAVACIVIFIACIIASVIVREESK